MHIRTVSLATFLVALLVGCGGPRVGSSAPAFSAVDNAGNAVSLDAYRGQALILDFWAVW